MKNRYNDVLRKYNQQILALNASNETLRLVTALEVKKHCPRGGKILEIGTGEGDSAIDLLENTGLWFDSLDVSKEMINMAKKRLASYGQRVNFIQQDALEYLHKCGMYDVIFSQWTIHNFPWPEKILLFKAILAKLAPKGSLILMDKIYTGRDTVSCFKCSMRRFHRYLPLDAARAVIQHETEDIQDLYRMNEVPLLATLKEIGFSKVLVIDRIEKDVVLVATKGGS